MTTFAKRIALTLPPWYGGTHPNLDAIVAGFAAGHAQAFQQLEAVRPLLRLNTASGEMLDIFAYDFFGDNLPRGSNETDSAYRIRIKASLLTIKGTRPAFTAQLTALLGVVPVITDPRRPDDTGVSGNIANNLAPTLFYNSTGNDVLTNYNMPYQWFVRAQLTNPLLDMSQLYPQIASLMPAGTVCWLSAKLSNTVMTFNGAAMTFNGLPMTFGAP